MSRSISAVLVSLLALSAAHVGLCQTSTIADLAVGDLSILAEALAAAGLNETFAGEGTFTVFAPTNDAFAAFLETAGITKDELLAHPDLAKYLRYHVLSSEVMAADITNGQFATTLADLDIGFDLSDGVKIVHGDFPKANVTSADIEASNGVIHKVDTVLQFPTMNIAEMAAGTSALSTLLAALQAAELDGALAGDGPFTVFAPTDAAAMATLVELNLTAAQLLNSSDLASILQYHVTSGQVLSSVLTEDMDIETLGGMTLPFVLNGDTDDLTILTLANVDTPDLLATNGVVHVVNKMMVPAAVMGDDSGSWSLTKASVTAIVGGLMAVGIVIGF